MENLLYRQQVRAQAHLSASFARQIKAACHASFLYWLNTFCWTYRQKETDPNTGDEVPVTGSNSHRPFVSWPVQDEFATNLILAIRNGEDIAVRKSRDMGATWIIQAVLHWFWQFVPNTSFLELSRKEDLVDKAGDMDTLFEKHRYMNRMQPQFLLPSSIRDNYMNLENRTLGCSIIGESTNKHAGQGGRKTAVFLDEFGRVDNGDEIELATADTTACRIFNSTPTGPGSAFQKLVLSGRVKVFEMHWHRHPEKSVGAKEVLDPVSGKIVWTSEWYKKECLRRSKKDVAQNLDMDFGAAGDVFFDLSELALHRKHHCKSPSAIGMLEMKYAKRDLRESERDQFVRQHRAEWVEFVPKSGKVGWRFWIDLDDNGRPSQHTAYVMGVDISNGSGASNSVIEVMDVSSGRIVAEYADPFISPEGLADEAVKSAIWFGGVNGLPFVCWENNGPGGIFGRKVVKSGYSRFYRSLTEQQVREKKTPRWGWNSDAKKKEGLLGRLRESMKNGSVIVQNEAVIDEAADYVYDETGKVMPGRLASETGGGSATHGDRVIATALTILAKEAAPKLRERASSAPAHSFMWRRERRRKRELERDAWGR